MSGGREVCMRSSPNGAAVNRRGGQRLQVSRGLLPERDEYAVQSQRGAIGDQDDKHLCVCVYTCTGREGTSVQWREAVKASCPAWPWLRGGPRRGVRPAGEGRAVSLSPEESRTLNLPYLEEVFCAGVRGRLMLPDRRECGMDV